VGRRTLLLVVAVLIAAAGAGLVFAYVHGVNDRAQKNEHPVEVLVAKQTIAAGTSARDAERAGSFQLARIPQRLVAPGALSDISPIANDVALSVIFPGEQILAAKFGSHAAVSSLPIPKGNFAISVQLADPARVAGFVTPGSAVTVIATVDDGALTQVVLTRAVVLAVGPSTTISTSTQSGGVVNTEDIPKAILTLSVNQAQAQKVIEAQALGDLYFGLLDADSRVGHGGPITRGNLFK
jgi:pilus assembly protein CpaB